MKYRGIADRRRGGPGHLFSCSRWASFQDAVKFTPYLKGTFAIQSGALKAHRTLGRASRHRCVPSRCAYVTDGRAHSLARRAPLNSPGVCQSKAPWALLIACASYSSTRWVMLCNTHDASGGPYAVVRAPALALTTKTPCSCVTKQATRRLAPAPV